MTSPTKRTRMKLSHLVPTVVQMRADGRTLQQIGDELKLTRQRVSQITKAAERLEQVQAQWGWPFSVRTFNVLERLAVNDKKEALALYHSGHLHPSVVTGFGWVSYKEICDWLEVPMLKQRPKAPRLCPHCGQAA